MSSLSSVKFLGEGLNFSEVDECLAEIVELRRVKQVHTANENENIAANSSVDSDASMLVEDGKPATLSQSRVLCSMPYNQDNRLEVVLTAIDFARHKQQRDGSSNDVYTAAATATASTGTSSNNGSVSGNVLPDHHVHLAAVVMSSADNFEAELAHRRKLEHLSSWRRQLMSKLEIGDSSWNGGGGGGGGGGDDTDGSDTDKRSDDCDNGDPFVLSREALLADLDDDDVHLEQIILDCL